MRTFVGEVPLSVVAAVIAVAIALVLSRATAHRLGTPRPVAALLVLGFGLVISATLVPTADAVAGQASNGVCDLSRIGLAPLDELTRVTLSSLNVLLLIPLGLAVGMLPRSRAAAAVTVAAVVLPFAVEAIQLVATPLGRGCQSADVFDNLLGLVVGIALGTLARPLLGLLPRPRG
jgi:hypothetical protein